MSEVDNINHWLEDQGKSLDGRPLFKLSWSDSQFEWRRGTFHDFSEEGLFLRTVTETRWTKKYSYIHNRWILEMLIPPEFAANSELPDSKNGSYEPLYVFEDKDGNFLHPTRKAVEFLVNYCKNADTSGDKKCRIQNEYDAVEDKKIEQEVDSLDLSPLQNSLRMKEAIGFGKSKNG